MTTFANANASFAELQIKGVVYRFSPLSHKDLGELERWVQDYYVRVAVRNMDGQSSETREKMLDSAYRLASSMTFLNPEALSILSSQEGFVQQVYLFLRKQHSTISVEDVQLLTTDPVDVVNIRALMNFLSADEVQEKLAKESKKKLGRWKIFRFFIATLLRNMAFRLTR